MPLPLLMYYTKRRRYLDILVDYVHDFSRFIKYSSSMKVHLQEQMQAYILKHYHAVEKGLSLCNRRSGFGVAKILELIDVINAYILKYGTDKICEGAITCLNEYVKFCKEEGNLNEEIEKKVNKLNDYVNAGEAGSGGTKVISRDYVYKNIDFNFKGFMKSRHSTREFTGEPVKSELLLKAVDLARTTPSVCNRQAWKVYLINDPKNPIMSKFLKNQNGNRGFENISSIMVIVGKLSSFFQKERNQVYIDGGMFSMSLILALHSLGLGTCCLNNSFTAKQTKSFLKVTSMDKDCVPIMYIAVGHLKPSYKVAKSYRKELDNIVSIVE